MHFNVIKDLLLDTLREYKADKNSLKEMSNILETLRKDIITMKSTICEKLGGEAVIE